MVAKITQVQSPLNVLLNQVLIVTVIPKSLNCATFFKHLLSIYVMILP
jgi:hypothetical protein